MTNEEMAILIKQGRTELYNDLWRQMKRILILKASSFYSKYYNRFIACGIELEDLEQECYFVLVDMVNAYDPEKGYKLTAYIGFQMKNRIRRLILLFNRDGRHKDALDVASSLDGNINGFDDEELTLLDTVEDTTAAEDFKQADESMYQSELKQAIQTAITESLDETQQKVINLRFYNQASLEQTSRACDITPSQARATEQNALRKLRARRELKPFAEDYITSHAFDFTSLGSFKSRWASSQELIIERLDLKERQAKQL